MSISKDFVVKSGLQVQSTSSAVSTLSGALIVAGGAAIADNIYAGGRANIGVTPSLQGAESSSTTGIQTVQISGGGLGVIGNSFIDGDLGTRGTVRINSSTEAQSTTTGALVVKGGAGFGGSIWAHGAIYIDGAPALTAASIADYGVNNIVAGTDTAVNTSTGYVTVWSTATLQSITNRGATTTNVVTFANTSDSSVIVLGGVNVAGTGTFNSNVDATTSTGGALDIIGGVRVTKSVHANRIYIDGNSYSTTDVASNALAITAGGLGVLNDSLFKNNLVIDGPTSSGNTNSSQALLVTGGVGVGGTLAAGVVATADTTQATTAGAGSLQVAGGAYIADNLVVNGLESSLITTSSNALYVAGGAGIAGGLTVGGLTTFASNVTFNGGATYVYSTNTYYTDNLLDLHVPPTGVQDPWTVNDGKDVGLRFHYYSAGDQNAALLLANDTNLLEWYITGSEDGLGNFVGGTYGGIRSATLQLVDATANGQNTSTGALRISGGAGIGKNLWLGGVGSTESSSTVATQALVINAGGLGVTGFSYFGSGLGIAGTGVSSNNVTVTGGTASNTTATTQGLQVTSGGVGVTGDSYFANILAAHTATIETNLTVAGTIYGTATTATTAFNIAGGATGSIPIQSSAGETSFIAPGPNGYVLTSAGTTATWTSPGSLTGATSTNALNIQVIPTTVDATFYIPLVNLASGFSADYTDSTLTYNPNTHIATFGGTVDSTTSTTGTVVINGGLGVAKSVQIAGTLTAFGGVVASSVYDNGSRVVTSVTPTAGTGIEITTASTAGTSATFTIANTGVTSLTAGTDTTVNTSTGVVTVWSNSTLQTVTDRGNSTTNVIVINATTASNSPTTGALKVAGGAGVSGNINVGGSLVRTGNISAAEWGSNGIAVISTDSTFTDLTSTGAKGLVAINKLGVPTIVAAGGTPTYSDAATLNIGGAPVAGSGATITNPWALLVSAGNVKIAAGAVSGSTTTGALVVGGGVGIAGAVYAGGPITSGNQTTGTVVTGFATNNVALASYTSEELNASATVILDQWAVAAYRTAKYMVQLVDASFTPNRVHATEIMLFHDGSGSVYKSEYGIVTNVGELGTFDAAVTAGTMQLSFTPSTTLAPTALVVKAYRTSITA